MVEFGLVEAVVLTYTGVALFLSLYFVPFKIVPRAWAKAVQTEGHPAKKALDAVLDQAVAKIKFPAIEKPDLSGLKLQIDLSDQFKSPEFLSAMETAFKSAWGRRLSTTLLNEEGGLTPEQQAELDALARDPEGKAQLVAYEAALDWASTPPQKYLKPGTAKALKKQLRAAFESGRPLEAIVEPYIALLERFTGGAAPSVRLAGGGSRGGAGPV